MTEPCTQEERLRAMASDITELRAAIGQPPNRATGQSGTGLVGSVTEVLVWVAEERASRTAEAALPGLRLRTLQTWVAGLVILVAAGTVIGSIASAVVWLARRAW